jgi:hypothetical protein
MDGVNMSYTISTRLSSMYSEDTRLGAISSAIAPIMQADVLFDTLIHWTAHLIACFSVTVSLLICMALILFACLCLFELAIASVREVGIF